MAYTHFSSTTPAASQDGVDVPASALANDKASRDAIIIGAVHGFLFSASGGTAAEPAFWFWKNGTTWLRAALTWGTTGGEDGNPTTIVWALSINSGSDYTTAPGGAIDTQTFTWDGNGELTATTGNGGVVSWLMGLIGKYTRLRTEFDALEAGLYDPTDINVSGGDLVNVAIQACSIDNSVIGATTMALASFLASRSKALGVAFSAGVGATTTLSMAAAEVQSFTATGAGASTLAISNPPPSGRRGWLVLKGTNLGLRTWTWPTGTKHPGGVAPTLSAAGIDELVFSTDDGGTTFLLTVRALAFS